jgi:peptidoglycan hydrolase CwlO-like protein
MAYQKKKENNMNTWEEMNKLRKEMGEMRKMMARQNELLERVVRAVERMAEGSGGEKKGKPFKNFLLEDY